MVEQTSIEQAKRELLETGEQLSLQATRVRQDLRFVAAVAASLAVVLLSVPALRRRTFDFVRSLLSMTTLCGDIDKTHHGGP